MNFSNVKEQKYTFFDEKEEIICEYILRELIKCLVHGYDIKRIYCKFKKYVGEMGERTRGYDYIFNWNTSN